MIYDRSMASLQHALIKKVRSDPFTRRASINYKADNSAHTMCSCRMCTELGSNLVIHKLSCSLSHVTEAGEEPGWWNEAIADLDLYKYCYCIGYCASWNWPRLAEAMSDKIVYLVLLRAYLNYWRRHSWYTLSKVLYEMKLVIILHTPTFFMSSCV